MKKKTCFVLTLFVISFIFSTFSPVTSQGESGEGWLGISIRTLDKEDLEDEDYGVKEGVLVTSVESGSPAYMAGITTGDVIIRFDSRDVYSSSRLQRLVRNREPGEKVNIVLMRNKARKTVNVIIGEMPDDEESDFPYIYKAPHVEIFREKYGWLGISFVELNEKLGEYFQNTGGKGILVTSVEEESPAEEAGLVPGDVIVALDGKSIVTGKELSEALKDKGNETVEITYIRKGREHKIEQELEEDYYRTPEIRNFFKWDFWYPDRKYRFYVPDIRERYFDRDESDDDVEERLRRELRDRRRYKGDIDKLREELEQLRKEMRDLKRRGR